MRVSRLVTVLVCVCAVSGCDRVPESSSLASDDRASYQYLLKAFDPERLGAGEDVNSAGTIDQPMAYGGIAAAASLAGDLENARRAADWLVANSRHSNGTGWGLGWEWDAFGDGSVNPADAIYAITTAIAVEGLLNAYEAAGDQKYLDTAVEALASYMPYTTRTEAGAYFWYSNQPADQKSIFNVSAMLAGMFARAGSMTGRDDFRHVARLVLDDLLWNATDANGHPSWEYGPRTGSSPRWNDLVHAGYIAYGVLLADRHLGTNLVDKQRIHAYLNGFFSPDGKPREYRPGEAGRAAAERRARIWGVGMMALTFFELGDRESGLKALRAVADYEFAPYQFAYRFKRKRSLSRATSHVLLAAAAAEHSRASSEASHMP